ncbi:MAG TPA: hypothetical protein VEV61_00795 [Streptosporangiaceae bacterium]|nr:hypothetical protein [Streptosporangiaceae bacterium]
MRQREVRVWIIVAVVACAGLGAWLGDRISAGDGGTTALISISCAVLGSFVPGAIIWLRSRLRDRNPGHHGAA